MTILTALVGVLAVVNYVGVKSGARASDLFTALKLLLLSTFIGAGLWWLGAHGTVTPAPLMHAIESRDWLEATLVLGCTRTVDSKLCCSPAARCAIPGTMCQSH